MREDAFAVGMYLGSLLLIIVGLVFAFCTVAFWNEMSHLEKRLRVPSSIVVTIGGFGLLTAFVFGGFGR